MFNKAQVIMLPQDKDGWSKGDITLCIDMIMSGSDSIGNIKIAKSDYPTSNPYHEAQHLYFLDNERGWRERLKDKDWFIFFPTDREAELHQFHSDYFYGIKTYTNYNEADGSSLVVSGTQCSGAIIASTDLALGLPTIPTAWIRDEYVPSNGSIKEVSLQIEAKYDVTTGIFTRFDLVFDDDGSVIIVDETIIGWSEEDKLKAYNDGKSSNLETYDWVNYKLPEKHGGPYTYGDIKNTYRKGFYEHQELEDAAKESVGEIEDMAGMAGYNGFIKGATWQKEQSATDTIEFFKWVNLNYIEHGSHYEDNIKVSSYVHRSNGGVPSRIEKLYELFQTSKTN